MVKLGVYGLGRWGRLLVQSVANISSKVRFVAGTTRSPEKAREFCVRHEINLCTDYADLLARNDVDAIVLATPHSQHFEQIMAAVGAKKHVFCEKPFTLLRAETQTALAAIHAAGLVVSTGFNRRFSPNMMALKQMLNEGALGRLVHIEGQFSMNMTALGQNWRASRTESPAGGMASLGMHMVDAFIYLLGPVAGLEARSSKIVMPYDIDDSTRVLLDFSGGQTGYFGTLASSAPLWHIRVYGTDAWAELRELSCLEVVKNDRSSVVRTWDGYEYPSIKTIAANLDAFGDAILGVAAPAISAQEILHGIEIFEAIVRSAATGEAQQL